MSSPTKIKENLFLIEPMRYVAALQSNLLNIILIISAFGFLGYSFATKQSTKSWSATTKIIRYQKEVSSSSDIPYQFQNFNYSTALETIRSRTNLTEFIKELQLQESETPESVFSKFNIKRGRKSEITEVTFTVNNAEMAAQGANTLSKIFIKNFSTVQNAAIEQIYSYYEKNKQLKKNELIQAKGATASFLKEHNINSMEDELSNQYKLLEIIISEQLTNTIKITDYQTTIQVIQNSMINLPEEKKFQYVIRSDKKKILEVKQKELEMLKKIYTNLHPKIKMKMSEITQIKTMIAENKVAEPDQTTYGENPIKGALKIQLREKTIQLSSVKNVQKSLSEEKQRVQDKIAVLNSLNNTYFVLKKNQEQSQKQLDLVTNRLHELKISIGSSKEDFKLFETAKVPQFPKASHKKAFFVAFLFLGVISSLLIFIIKEFLNQSVKTRFDLIKRFGIDEMIQLPSIKVLNTDMKRRFSYLANTIIRSESNQTKLITVGSDTSQTSQPNVISMLLEQLDQQQQQTLHVKIILKQDKSEGQDASFNMKQDLQEKSFSPKKVGKNVHKLYWCLSEDYSVFIPKSKMVESTVNKLRDLAYDYVVIEMCGYTEADHLIPALIDQSDIFLLTADFGVSSRKIIHQLMLRIKEESIEKTKGVICNVQKPFIY